MGEPSGRFFPRQDFDDVHAIPGVGGQAAGKKRFYFFGELFAYNFIGINIQQPIITALVFAETLLLAIARPAIENNSRPGGTAYGHRIVFAAAIDDDGFGRPLEPFQAALDIVLFVPSEDERGDT